MYKIIVTFLFSFYVSGAAASPFIQCSNGDPDNPLSYTIYGKDGVGDSDSDFLAPVAQARICVTSSDHKALLDIWDDQGEHITDINYPSSEEEDRDESGMVWLVGPQNGYFESKTCWKGKATRIVFQASEVDLTKSVCVEGFIDTVN